MSSNRLAPQLLRLSAIVGAFVFVAASIQPAPGGSASADSGQAESSAIALSDDDRRRIARGQTSDAVGTTLESFDLVSFDDGGPLRLTNAGKPVLYLFAQPQCEACEGEIAKLSALSVVFGDQIYAAIVASGGESIGVKVLRDFASGGSVLFGGEDVDNRLATALKIDSRPTTVVVGSDGTVDGIFIEPLPLNVYYGFLRSEYKLEANPNR